MRLSLRGRLLIPPILLLLGTVGATAWAASHAASTVERQVADKIRAVEQSVVGPPTFRLTDPILRQIRALTGVELLLVTPSGERIATAGDLQPAGDSSPPGSVVRFGEIDYRPVRFPVRPPHPNEGATLYLFYPEAQRLAAIREAVWPALWLGSVGGLVSFALAVVTARRLVSRIRRVELRTRDIAAGRFDPIPLPKTDDEVRDLVVSVNEMSRKLAEYQTALQQTERLRILGQFSGGLAHQLRNAAAGAKLAVQLFLNEDRPSDVEPLRVALRQLARMETNLRQFLDLGRPDQHRQEKLNFITILDQSVESLLPQARHTGTTLVWQNAIPSLDLVGDGIQLGHLLTNLLSNAVEAAGPGGTVEMTLDAMPEHIRVTVTDSGPGPPSAIAGRLFEPFVTGKDQGVGLGLAVAKQAVDSHHGQLLWERQNGLTSFIITLPRQPLCSERC
ncbi:sensor histidine kinase [Limnoglobus roseus]|uniref:histidine kinase n=1 Tax=Limnoglobus roseus TaxID=2598579 RepID=A0A5C1AJV9_9BACT|nr:HAMP domain-containing sensor histidine kinase [Limnoglobus roseus]QEL17982.1 sensor histidine kinase [Limnoglobus roseus]